MLEMQGMSLNELTPSESLVTSDDDEVKVRPPFLRSGQYR